MSGPLRVARAVPVVRQFAVVGTIHSLAIAAFVGFLAIIALKLGADALRGGDNLPSALAWGVVAFGVSFLGLWSFHYWKLIVQRGGTSYLIFDDRVEVRRDGLAAPVAAIPLAAVVAVQSWTGPLLRPHGLATLTLVVEAPSGTPGRPRHVFHPLPNVPEPDAFLAQVESLTGRAGRPA